MGYLLALTVLLTFVSSFLLSYVLIGYALEEWDYHRNYSPEGKGHDCDCSH